VTGEIVRSFEIAVPPAELDGLRSRLAGTRWPSREVVPGWEQGVPLDELRALCDYWAGDYDWRARERRLNSVPQFVTAIDGVDIHFAWLRSPRPEHAPLLLTHGWPGTFAEYVDVGRMLAVDRDVVIPSLPGYGFSGTPSSPGWGVDRIADAWAELMTRLGYPRFGAAGSDWGTSISTALGARSPARLVGVHLIPPLAAPGTAPFTDDERSMIDAAAERGRTGSAYGLLHKTRPQTIGYGLDDSPALFAAWIFERFHEWVDGELFEVVDRDTVLDDISIYWFTRTGASSARLYWESLATVEAVVSGADGAPLTVPVGATVFPAEVPRASRRWVLRRFPTLTHWGEPPRGGHFAALEQPDALAGELRAFFDSL
jgi:pimeloyl-ACP methyl ester carboxylesterase